MQGLIPLHIVYKKGGHTVNYNYKLPALYDKINLYNGTYQPSQIKTYNTQQYQIWKRALFYRAMSVLDVKMPEEWKSHHDFFMFCLLAYGYVGVMNLEEFGKCFNFGTLYGYNFYYEPTHFILCNPAIKQQYKNGRKLEIGTECQIVKFMPDYTGVWDLVCYYAEKLATMDVAINTAIINSKFAYVVGAKNKASAEVLKKLFDKVNSGEPAVFFDKKLANDGTDKEEPWQALFRDTKTSYILTDLLRDFQTIVNNFDNEVGIVTLPYEKKERLVTFEAESKEAEAESRTIIWQRELERTLEMANEFLGFTGDDKLELEMTLRKGDEDGTVQDNTDRRVQMDDEQ